jgi:hypothetical protein
MFTDFNKSYINESNTNLSIGQLVTGGENPTGYISNIRVTNTAVYTAAFTPPTTPLTPIANTALLTCADNRIVDDSINNFTITKNGDVSVQRFSPFNPVSVTPTSYSGYFDGTGDYLTTPSDAALALTGDFTVELWFYANTFANIPGFFIIGNTASNTGRFQAGVNTNGSPFFYLRNNAGTEVTATGSAGSAVIGGWYHIAVVRNGNVYTMYLNGVSIATVTSATVMTYAANICNIGANRQSNALQYWNGYISNFRIVKGTAVYTSAFTPPSAPLTAIANTSLLTCQSPTFIDNSTNNFTITAAGNSQPTQQNPFGFTSATTMGYTASTIGGSGYFDGSGDWLSIPNNSALNMGSNDFTYECWLYPTSIPNTYQSFIEKRTGGGSYSSVLLALKSTGKYSILVASNVSTWGIVDESTINVVLNTWQHLAAVRSGNTFSVYLNGIRQISTSLAFTVYDDNAIQGIGAGDSSGAQPYYGFIGDVRIVKGTAVYTSNFVPPASPLQAITNTSLLTNMTSAGIYDAATMTPIETVGDAKLSTAISKFGGTSMAFDGSGDNLYSPTSINYNCSTGNFTVEAWVYISSYPGLYPLIIGNNNGSFSAGAISFTAQNSTSGGANKISVSVYDINSSAVTLAASSTNSFNTWYHVALVRNGTNLSLYRDGISVASTTISSSIVFDWGKNGSLIGGGNWDGANGAFNGYIDDLRITKGYARYTSNFTPPTESFKIK